MTFTIIEDRTGKTGIDLRGGALSLWRHRGPEVLLSGPAETGKTFACLVKLDTLLWKYPKSQAVLARKVRDTIYPTVLQTYLGKVLGPNTPVRAYGGERPVWFDYPNRSRLWLAGLDDPGKALSSERDFIYINQTEELAEDDWQVLTTRTTGRAGNAPYGQILGDCNPGPPHHWIKSRARDGRLVLIESRHEDNPTLWDGSDWTEQGRRTIEALDALTGVRKQRLRFGLWVQAEGLVYEGWDPAIHLIEPFKIPESWPRYWGVDFGYTNPFACGFVAQDPDGRLYVYREIYHTGRLVEDHAKRLHSLQDQRPRSIICDHDAEDRATLDKHLRMPTVAAKKEISPGIQAVASRLRRAGDGKPRLFIFKRILDEVDPALVESKKPTCLAEELDSYVWDTRAGRKKGEQPMDLHNHACDWLRYVVYWLDGKPRPGWGDGKVSAGKTWVEQAPRGAFG